eukprot:3429891-Rhodomonas_salina.1
MTPFSCPGTTIRRHQYWHGRRSIATSVLRYARTMVVCIGRYGRVRREMRGCYECAHRLGVG